MILPVIEVVSAEYLGDYALKIQFNDGRLQVIHFKSFIFNNLHPEIVKYRDESLFKEFTVSNGDLEWHDYSLCFPIADLYENKNIEVDAAHAA